jgi:ABC-type branched-subunit amino acid transport system substrate-binding protein
MGWVAPFVLAALVALPDAAGAQTSSGAAGAGAADTLAIGQRIYREGILPSGRPLEGVAQANVPRVGSDAACAACHRRSGYGSSEGSLEIRSIAGPALYGKQDLPPATTRAGPVGPGLSPAEAARAAAANARNTRIATLSGTRQRPVYDDVALGRAIRDGVDVTGRKMSPGMPRYALDDDAIGSLTAYLKTLSAQPSAGVTDDTIHFATVIQPGADAAQRSAMLDVFQAFVEDTNAGMRSELRREKSGLLHLGRTHRQWALHVWELNGPSDTWVRQLEAYYSRQPVFALIGGLGNASWRPVSEFSERYEVPCIFPLADVPVVADPGYYTVYLSKGIVLEAEALAKYLQEQGERGPVTQIFRRDDASAAGADAFRKAWQAGAGTAPGERVLNETPTRAFWQQLARETPRSTLVLWLQPQDLAETQALTEAGSQVKVIYLSSTLLAGKRKGIAADGEGRIRLVYPQDLPAAREARLNTVKLWLRKKGIALSDEKVQMDAYLAVTYTGLAVAHSMDTYSRDFLLERLEHMVGNTNAPSLYPHLSLGPGQRFASKGSYIVQVGGADDGQLKPVSAWIVP